MISLFFCSDFIEGVSQWRGLVNYLNFWCPKPLLLYFFLMLLLHRLRRIRGIEEGLRVIILHLCFQFPAKAVLLRNDVTDFLEMVSTESATMSSMLCNNLVHI